VSAIPTLVTKYFSRFKTGMVRWRSHLLSLTTVAMFTWVLKVCHNCDSCSTQQKMNIAAFLTTNGVNGIIANQSRVGGAFVKTS
jgi:hypothetical protein